MEGRLVQLDFSAVFDTVNHRDLLYKLRSTDVGEQSCSWYRSFFIIKKQRLDGKVSRVS